MNAASLIINRSSTQPAWTRALDMVLSALVWLLYLFLIRQALIDLYYLATESFAWLFAGADRPSAPTLGRLFDTLRDYAMVIVANGATLILWARYNQLRFSGQHQRGNGNPVSVHDLAALYRLPADDVASWQAARILTMQHHADGTLAWVTETGVGSGAPR